uniref:Uncharacterized protein n=1 Tax=Plectus sambesii TaxID=2011161 RepID=A0A914WAT5_9BILA
MTNQQVTTSPPAANNRRRRVTRGLGEAAARLSTGRNHPNQRNGPIERSMDSTLDIGRCRGAHSRPPSALSTIRLGHAAVSQVRRPFRTASGTVTSGSQVITGASATHPTDYRLAPIGDESTKYVPIGHHSILLRQSLRETRIKKANMTQKIADAAVLQKAKANKDENSV